MRITYFKKMLAPSLFLPKNVRVMFLKQPVRIRAPHHLKRPVRLSARDSCAKLHTCFRNFLLSIERFSKSEKIQKYVFGRERPKYKNKIHKCTKNRQMRRNILNAHVYAKHKINLKWPD